MIFENEKPLIKQALCHLHNKGNVDISIKSHFTTYYLEFNWDYLAKNIMKEYSLKNEREIVDLQYEFNNEDEETGELYTVTEVDSSVVVYLEDKMRNTDKDSIEYLELALIKYFLIYAHNITEDFDEESLKRHMKLDGASDNSSWGIPQDFVSEISKSINK